MNFSCLPDNAFLKIFEYLPLEDCVRVGRVNKAFRRIVQLATSRTKCLDLSEYRRFRYLTADQLAVILDLCWPNLERINIWRGGFDRTLRAEKYQNVLANYECPRLTDMNLGHIPIDQAIFERLIRNCPNMASLVWRKDFIGFPPITNNNLKKLHLQIINNAASLQSLIDRCPNLEEIILWLQNVPAYVLDQFFASVPRIQRIEMDLFSVESAQFVTQVVSFWNLSLTSLKVNCFAFNGTFPGDILLSKVATSFPHLQELNLGSLEPTNQGIASLGALQELQVLHLALLNNGHPYDQGIRQLARCQNLRELDVVPSDMTGGTLVHLFQRCHQLEYVRISNMTEVDSPQEAVVIVESLAGIPQRDITIKSYPRCFQTFKSIWKAGRVKVAINELEENDGLKITIN